MIIFCVLVARIGFVIIVKSDEKRKTERGREREREDVKNNHDTENKQTCKSKVYLEYVNKHIGKYKP